MDLYELPIKFKYDKRIDIEIVSIKNNLYRCYVYRDDVKLSEKEITSQEIRDIVQVAIGNFNLALSKISEA